MTEPAAPLTAIHTVWKIPQLSTLTDTISWALTYFASAGPAPTITDVNNLVAFLVTSMGTVPAGGSQAPQSYLSATTDPGTNHAWIEAYDVSQNLAGKTEAEGGVPAGPPVSTIYYTLAPHVSTTTAIPEGVAAAISFNAAYGSDPEFGPPVPPSSSHTRPKSRDRGRIYFGPLESNALAVETGTNRSQISGTTRSDLLKWIHAIATFTTIAGVVWDLGVWSRVAAIIKQIVEAQMDDRPDYQRRRSDPSTTKTTLPIP